jgi:hypothetical protein
MLVIDPERVEFAGVVWAHVTGVAFSEAGQEVIEEVGDQGPRVVLVDVPVVRARVTVRQELAASSLHAPRVGARGVLRVRVSGAGADGAVATLACTCVVLSVAHALDARGASRVIECACESASGVGEAVVWE